MRRGTLLTQVLLVNLLLIAAAVVAAGLASSPDESFRDEGAGGVVLGFALAGTVAVNVFLLSRRFQPLERLADEMERVNLSRPLSEQITTGRGGSDEVKRLEQTFNRMLERLEAERRRASSAALEAQERERARVARDLHDEVNQALTGVVLRVEALRAQAPEELAEGLAEVRTVANQAMTELLRMARQLRPTALDDHGLEAALSGLVEEIDGLPDLTATVSFDGGFANLDPDKQLVTYRVAQEALSNAVRHARATEVRMTLTCHGDRFELLVGDNGAGFDARGPHDGLGLAGMRERAILVGGRLTIESQRGLGARVRLSIPTVRLEGDSDERRGDDAGADS